MTRRSRRFAAVGLVLSLAGAAAGAADVKVVSSVGMSALLLELQPRFERATQHKLIFSFGSAAPLKRQIDDGEVFDVAVLTPPMLADLAMSGKIAADSVIDVAKTGMGLAARRDAARVDIGSEQALKRVLLAAKFVAYSKEGQSGIAAARVIERLGITEAMRSHIVVETRPGGSVTAVLEGNADLGFGLLSEIIPTPEVRLLGPLPGDLQSFIVFTAGVSSHAADSAAARSFVDFLRSSAARPAFAAKGLSAP
jgi:molybdate transport system substrate-binding protein